MRIWRRSWDRPNPPPVGCVPPLPPPPPPVPPGPGQLLAAIEILDDALAAAAKALDSDVAYDVEAILDRIDWARHTARAAVRFPDDARGA